MGWNLTGNMAAPVTDENVEDQVTSGPLTGAALTAKIAAEIVAGAADERIAEITNARARRFDIRDYGAKVDGVKLTDVATVAGQPTVDSTGYNFVAGDVGKTIAVIGAGPVVGANDGVWLSTIISVVAGVATLGSNATTTVANGDCRFGTPDDQAVSDAQDAAYNAGGGEVFLPAGRTVVTQSLTVKNYVQWAGVNRDVSHVEVLRDGLNWLNASGYAYPSNLLTGVSFHDFSIHCKGFFRTAGYSASIKPLNIFNQTRADIFRMGIYDSPATAIPFDAAKDYSVIAYNYIVRPGRLGTPGIGPGSSGIGLGTRGLGDVEPTLVIGNVVIGNHTAGVTGLGNNGIFLEMQGGGAAATETPGYRIIGNTVIAMPHGIADDGSRGTIISGNTLIGCGQGISLNVGGVVGGHPGKDTLIVGNTILDSTGPGADDGNGIHITTYRASFGAHPEMVPTIRTMIHDNQIARCAKHGLLLEVHSVEIHGVTIRGNSIRDCGLSGIALLKATGNTVDRLRWVSITDNQISNNGTLLTNGDDYAILCNLKYIGGRVQNNDLFNIDAPTQAGLVKFSGTINTQLVDGNTTALEDYLADLGVHAAGTVVGVTLADGVKTTGVVWGSPLGPGAWEYTGTAVKQISGATTVQPFSTAGLGVNGQYGSIHAKVKAIHATAPLVGVAARAGATSDYIRLAVQNSTNRWRLTRTIGGSATNLWEGTVAPAVGDVIRLCMDATTVRAYVNGVKTFEGAHGMAAITTQAWGVVGNFTVDPTSSLEAIGWTTNYD